MAISNLAATERTREMLKERGTEAILRKCAQANSSDSMLTGVLSLSPSLPLSLSPSLPPSLSLSVALSPFFHRSGLMCQRVAVSVLFGPGNGFKMAMMGLDGGRINIGTCSIGAAQRAFEITREHVQVCVRTVAG